MATALPMEMAFLVAISPAIVCDEECTLQYGFVWRCWFTANDKGPCSVVCLQSLV